MTRLARWARGTGLSVALIGLLVSLVTLAGSQGGPGPAVEVRGPAAVDTDPPPSRDTRSPEPPGDRVGRASAALPASPGGAPPPVLLRASTIGLSAGVDRVGVGADQQMRLPADPRRLGWYQYGPAPGEGRGAAVLAGHVDSARYGVGPLARLGELQAGDTVAVRLASGAWRRFRVDSIQRFERQALPDSIFTRSGPERLRLITCTGAYLADRGGYQENLVVTAVPS